MQAKCLARSCHTCCLLLLVACLVTPRLLLLLPSGQARHEGRQHILLFLAAATRAAAIADEGHVSALVCHLDLSLDACTRWPAGEMDEGQHNKAAGTCLLLVLPLPALQLKLKLALLPKLLQLACC